MTSAGTHRATNPFSPIAVARVSDFDTTEPDPTIATTAVRSATARLDEYVTGEPNPGGEVVAVVGEYGTGKTHLANLLFRRARARLGDHGTAVYVDVVDDNVLMLYRRFLHRLGFGALRDRVDDHYADVIAEVLQRTGMSTDVVSMLRAGELTAHKVVESLQLPESVLLRAVGETFHRLTGNRDFTTALTLLSRRGFDDAVHGWLSGDPPHATLVERGITTRIDDDASALEAIHVLTRLHGGTRTFVVVLDEIERLLTGTVHNGRTSPAVFEKLLEVFVHGGAYLVVCGLPELIGLLPPATRQRLSHVVDMTPLSADEVATFITRAQQLMWGEAGLAPFTPETVLFLRDLARGNARKVIRLCHATFRLVQNRARDIGRPETMVDTELVREAARDLHFDESMGHTGSAEADELFRTAVAALDDLTAHNPFDAIFDRATPSSRSGEASAAAVNAHGVALLVRSLVLSFRTAVAGSVAAPPEYLALLCTRYADSIRLLPLSDLLPLFEHAEAEESTLRRRFEDSVLDLGTRMRAALSGL